MATLPILSKSMGHKWILILGCTLGAGCDQSSEQSPVQATTKRMELANNQSALSTVVWPNHLYGEFKPDHEWMYRWPDDVMTTIAAPFVLAEPSFVDLSSENRGHTVRNWGKPIVLRHDPTQLTARVWFYEDLPRTIINPSPREVWPQWNELTVESKQCNAEQIRVGSIGIEGEQTIRMVIRRNELLVRIEYDELNIEKGCLFVIDLINSVPSEVPAVDRN